MTSASTYSEPVETPEPDPQVVAQATAVAALPQRQPPDLDQACILHGTADGPGVATVLIHQEALAQIADHGYSNLRCELGGALLGHAYRHNGRTYTEIKAALPARSDDHGPVHFTFTADAWAQLHVDREKHYPDLEIVGWFHTHPDLGVFYSSDDVVVHTAAFTLPWHVGLVLDPARHECAFFGWDQGTLRPLTGFYEKRDRQHESAIDWRVVRTAVWDHPYGDQQIYPQQTGVYLPPSRRPSLPPAGAYAGLIAGILGFLLSFFLLVAWVVPLTRQVNYLENTVLTLANETLPASYAQICPDPSTRILSPLNGNRLPLGTAVDIIGTTLYPGAARYELNVRPAATEAWQLLQRPRGGSDLSRLATWDTAELQPGVYELRLTAVDRNNIRLSDAAPCAVLVELVP